MFDVNRSRVSAGNLSKFVESDLVDDLTTVPGIGPANAAKLGHLDVGVRTTFQLIGACLLLKEPGMSPQDHADAMIRWLQGKGIDTHRSDIVQCIVGKIGVMCPGIYDSAKEEV